MCRMTSNSAVQSRRSYEVLPGSEVLPDRQAHQDNRGKQVSQGNVGHPARQGNRGGLDLQGFKAIWGQGERKESRDPVVYEGSLVQLVHQERMAPQAHQAPPDHLVNMVLLGSEDILVHKGPEEILE